MNVRARILASKLFISASWCTLAQAQIDIDKVHSQVLESVRDKGHALVLVGLKVAWKMEQTLNRTDLSAQRRAIKAAQDSLFAELNGSDYRIVREYQKIPGIALEIGPEALSILKKSNNVTNISPDPSIVTVTTEDPRRGSPTRTPTARKITIQTEKVPAELFQKAKNAGIVLVLVGLKAPWRPEGVLSEEMVRVQRKAIAAAQNYLLVELGTTRHRVTRLYKRIPGIALEVGPDALNVLAKSVAVTNVLPDRPPRATR
jgi:hypothetical protein